MEGSEALARAAIAAGCRFFAGYPMTPFTEVLEHFAKLLPEVGRRVHQRRVASSKRSAWRGARSPPAPAPRPARPARGSSLMQESFSEITLAELPLVDLQHGARPAGLLPGDARRRPRRLPPHRARAAGRRARASSSCSSRSTSPTSGATRCSSTATTCSRTRRRRSTIDADRRSPTLPAEGLGGRRHRVGHRRQSRASRRSASASSASATFGQEGKAQYIATKMPLMEREVRVETGYLDDAETVIVAFGSPAKFVKYAIEQLRAEGDEDRLRAADHAVAVPVRGGARRGRERARRVGVVRAVRGPDDRRRAHRRRRPGAGRVHRRRLDRPLRLRRRPAARRRSDPRADPRAAPRTRPHAADPRLREFTATRCSRTRRRQPDDARPTSRSDPCSTRRTRPTRRAHGRGRSKPDLLLTAGAPHVPGLRRAARGARSSSRRSSELGAGRSARSRVAGHRLLHVFSRHDGRRPRAGAARARAVGRDRREAHAARLARVHAPGRRRHGERGPAGGAAHRGARRERHVHPAEQRRVRRDRRPHDRARA